MTSVIIGVAVFLLALRTLRTLAGPTQIDFSIFYCSATSLRTGHNPYREGFAAIRDELGMKTSGIVIAGHTPTFLLCFEPLTLLSPSRAYAVWMFLSAVSLAASLWLLLGRRCSISGPTAWVVALLALAYAPVINNFFFAQSQTFILLLLVLILAALEREQEVAAGLLFALAILLRGYPAVLGFYFLMKRRVRLLVWTGIVLAVGGLVTIGMLGPARTFAFLGAIGSNASGHLPHSSEWSGFNVSLSRFIPRLLFVATGTEATSPALGVAVLLAQVGVLVITAKATNRLGSRVDLDWREFGLWIAATILVSPISWIHYMLLLLVPFIQLAKAFDYGSAALRSMVAVIASYVLVAPLPTSFPWFIVANPSRRIGEVGMMVPFVALALAYLGLYWFTADAVSCSRSSATASVTPPGILTEPPTART